MIMPMYKLKTKDSYFHNDIHYYKFVADVVKVSVRT